MEEYTRIFYLPVNKNYKVNRISTFGKTYNGDCEGLAQWYYANINQYSDNLIINIYGDFHQTFPNPYHLTVDYDNDGETTGKLHMSIDHNGYFSKLNISAGKNKRKKKKGKKNKSKKK